MHGTHTKYLLVAAGALVVGLLVAGTPVQALLPYVLLLACPLMMIVMMRGMGGHRGHDGGHQHNAAPRDGADTPVGPKPR